MNFKFNQREDKILKTFEDTILAVVSVLEKTQNEFVKQIAKVEIEHFKQVEKLNDKQNKLFEKTTDKFLEILESKPKVEKNLLDELEAKISRINPEEKNSIEENENLENPLQDFPNIPPEGLKNFQIEGEEEIYPTNIE